MGGLLREGERVKFTFILEEKAHFKIAFMCRHLGVSRRASARAFAESDGTRCGTPSRATS
jgi:hypothetical protein